MITRPAREPYLEVHQTHPDAITPYERKLAGSLTEIFTAGAATLRVTSRPALLVGVLNPLQCLGLAHGYGR